MDAAVRALAEPNRRAILQLVRDTELTAGDIANHFTISRPAVSQHLRLLEDADLVMVRREGTRRWYSAKPEGLTELRKWVEQFWIGGLNDLKLAAEQEQWRLNTRARLKKDSR